MKDPDMEDHLAGRSGEMYRTGIGPAHLEVRDLDCTVEFLEELFEESASVHSKLAPVGHSKCRTVS